MLPVQLGQRLSLELSVVPKPLVSDTARRVCLREQRCGDRRSGWPRGRGQDVTQPLAVQIKLGWGSRNGNQTKKNKPLPAAGWELPRVLALLLALPLPSSFLPAAALSPAVLRQLSSSIDSLFNLKPQLCLGGNLRFQQPSSNGQQGRP